MASNGDKVIYFMVGGFIGAAVALLFAPKTGEETRNYLENKYREGSDLVTRKTQEGKEMVRDKSAWLADKAREGKEALGEKSREMAEKVTDTVDKSRDALNRQKEHLSQAIEAGKHAYQQKKSELRPSEESPYETPTEKGPDPV